MQKNHKIIEINCSFKMSTDKAIQVTNLKDEDVWLPKSQIEIDNIDYINNIIEIQVPEWLAKDKELI